MAVAREQGKKAWLLSRLQMAGGGYRRGLPSQWCGGGRHGEKVHSGHNQMEGSNQNTRVRRAGPSQRRNQRGGRKGATGLA